MKIIFLQDTPSGKKNQIKDVSTGYALNYLIPQKLAILATAEQIKKIHSQTEQIINKIQKEKKQSNKIIDKIKSLKIEIKAKANEDGHLFGGISSEDIHKILKEKHKIDINKESIELHHHLKKIGDHKIPIKIDKEKVELKIQIKSK